MKNKKISLDELDAIVFDFDGVLTNNVVYLNEDGIESVACSRSDGLAFDVLRKLKKAAYILSTEKNPVVTARAKKLRIEAIQGIRNKTEAIVSLAENQGYNLEKILYVGNDLNDYRVMQMCGFSACPADSHEKIKQIATITLNTCGGKGVVRELLEDILNLDFIEILYPK